MNKVLVVLLLIGFSSSSHALTALEIAQKVDRLARESSKSSFSVAKMVSCKFNKVKAKLKCSERPRIKEMENISVQLGANDKDSKSLSILLSPPKEKGVGMLTYSYEDKSKDTESWLYLSALGKVKRLVTGNSETQEPVYIFGSEFTTEDMENGKVDDYSYKILNESKYNDRKVWQLESIPKPYQRKKSHYSKSIAFIDQKKFIPLKVQTFDKFGKPYKQLYFSKHEKINGYWIAKVIRVLNLKNNRMSQIQQKDLVMNVPIDMEFLTQRSLTDFVFREKHLNKLRKSIK